MNILLFGATGSIGMQSIEIIKKLGHKLVGCVFNTNIKNMKEIINNFKYKFHIYSRKVSIFNTVNSLEEMFEKTQPDLVINAISGFDGLEFTLKTLMNKIDLCLANKESYVVAGWVINNLMKIQKVNVYPIDSELSAIYDLSKKKRINKIMITASGGKYYNSNAQELEKINFYDAKNHPIWNMGYKISIDSSTLMNKCFEMISAYYIFNIKNIEAIYHPQSIVHAMIEYSDRSIHAHMATSNMKLSIALAISKFNSKVPFINKLSFSGLSLTFDTIDENKWLPIKWAKEFIISQNKALPIILNSANDYAVELFRDEKIKYTEIIRIIEKCYLKFRNYKILNVKDIFILNSIIKEYINSIIK